MALVTANGLTAYDFQMRRPRLGAWHADMLVDSSEELTGKIQVVVDDGFKTFVGTAIRTGEFAETAHLRVVGGAGGLGLAGAPKHYNSTSLGIVLRDYLRAAGETLSATADAGVLGTVIPTWTSAGMPIGVGIATLIDAAAPAGTAWRMLPDGTFWIGPETWPGAGVDAATYQIIDEPFEEASILVHLDRPAIDPGTIFEDRRVNYVQDDVPHTGPVQSRVWFEDDQHIGVARARASLQAIAAAARPAFEYRARYWARVIAQSGRTIDVQPEDPNVPGAGQVRLVLPPGESADGIVGGRVLLAWSGRDRAAYVEGFDGAESVGERVIGGAAVYVGGKDGAQLNLLGEDTFDYLGQLATAINAIAPGSVTPPSPTLLAGKARSA